MKVIENYDIMREKKESVALKNESENFGGISFGDCLHWCFYIRYKLWQGIGRSTMHESSRILGTLSAGEKLKRTGINKKLGWSRLEYNGITVYTITGYLENADGK